MGNVEPTLRWSLRVGCTTAKPESHFLRCFSPLHARAREWRRRLAPSLAIAVASALEVRGRPPAPAMYAAPVMGYIAAAPAGLIALTPAHDHIAQALVTFCTSGAYGSCVNFPVEAVSVATATSLSLFGLRLTETSGRLQTACEMTLIEPRVSLELKRSPLDSFDWIPHRDRDCRSLHR